MIPCRAGLPLLVAITLCGCEGARSPAPQAPPPDFRAPFDRAIQEQKAGRYQAAIASFEEALAIAPDHPGVNYELAGLRYIAGDPEKALEHISVALAHAGSPTSKALYNARRGNILAGLGRASEAAAVFEEVIAESPTSRDIYPDLCQTYLRLSEPAKVIETATKALDLDLDPNYAYYDALLHYYRGVAHQKKGDAEKSEADLREALRLCPQFPKPLYVLGNSLVKAGKTEEGSRMLDRYARLNKVQEQIDGARQDLVTTDGNDPGIRVALIHDYTILGQYREAEEQCAALLAASPGDPGIRVVMGDIQRLLKRYRSAEKCYKDVIALTPKRTEAYDGLALLYAMAEDESFRSMDAAWEVVRKAKIFGSINPETIAQLYLEEGKRDRAIATLRRALLNGEGDARRIRNRVRELEAEDESAGESPDDEAGKGEPAPEQEEASGERSQE